MGSEKRWYLFAYDVREPKRLKSVSKILEGYGIRVQYSLFRCRLTPRELERLRWELSRVMLSEDALMVVGLCSQCADRVHTTGCSHAWDSEFSTFEIV
ncbi:CRISPR-associated endonuclease Cas2 [Myxococcota bacterium]|nr:CRISPR-associated endonuclease Cas2 [Myxococcota bacterium]